MSTRNLSQGAIITNTRYFTGPLRAALLGEPTLAWAPAMLDRLLAQMVALESDPQAELVAAREAATASDATFDHLTRGIYWLCRAATSLALAEGDAAGAERFVRLGERLLPAGLVTVNWSYVEEAAEADRVEGRLEAADRALLAATPVFGRSFAEVVGAWQEAARTLGEADRARTDIEADITQNRGPALSRVRREWMDVIGAMRAASALLSESQRGNIFRKLDESERRADARVAARRAAGAASTVEDVDGVMPLDGSDVRAPEAEDAEAEIAAPVAPAAAAEQPAEQAAPEPAIAPQPIRQPLPGLPGQG